MVLVLLAQGSHNIWILLTKNVTLAIRPNASNALLKLYAPCVKGASSSISQELTKEAPASLAQTMVK